jgi:hypothetical protein
MSALPPPTAPALINQDYVDYDAEGNIVTAGHMDLAVIDYLISIGGVMMKTDRAASVINDYVDLTDHTLKAKVPSTAVLNGMQLTGLVNPSDVTIDQQTRVRVTDGVLNLSFPVPGTYTVEVKTISQHDATFTVTQP